MSTQEPTPLSPSEQEAKIEAELKTAQEDLKKHGITAKALAILIMEPNEMLFGEVFEGPSHLSSDAPICLKSPKRFSRMVFIDGQTGATQIQLRFSDFDFIHDGLIEVFPKGFFFLDWTDSISQLSYCRAYLNFLEGRVRARAAQAGVIPVGASALSQLHELQMRNKK